MRQSERSVWKLALVVGFLILTTRAGAQEEALEASSENPSRVSGAAAPAATSPSTQPANRPQPEARPGGKTNPQPAGGNKPGEAKKDEAKKEEEAPITKRPTSPPKPADPEELKLRPGEDGLVRFSFNGQPWTEVMQWLSEVSGMSLDWQELPGDYLNLTTQEGYTLAEARDLINRHLLARGFTILQQGELLSVVNISKINPALVPSVLPEQLDGRMPYEFVRTSFALDWLLAEEAAKELEPLVAPHGKITPLKATNRLDVMGPVVNLREVNRLLIEEQSPDNVLVREFPLRFTRAADVVKQLETMLGIEPKSNTPLTPQQMQMMQQQMRSQPQPQPGQPAQAAAAPSQKKDEVHLLALERKNSIAVHAPPDQMAVINSAIQLIDVPTGFGQGFGGIGVQMEVYRPVAISPEQLVEALNALGSLEPTSRLVVDDKNNALIAYASASDQMVISRMVDRLDGSGRSLKVIGLRRLAADQVAGTVQFLMSGDKEENNNSRSRYYYPYGMYGQQEESKGNDEFRVSANLEHNQLLLWANPIELEEVNKMLVELGEIPAHGSDPRRVRVLDSIPPEQAIELIERLRQAWPALAPNDFVAPELRGNGEAAEGDSSAEDENSRRTTSAASDQHQYQFAQYSPSASERGESAGAEASQDDQRVAQQDALSQEDRVRPAPAAPPVRISLDPQGRLVIASQDTQALDLLEELVSQMAPPRREYHVFHLKNASAYWVAYTLEAFFEEDEEEDSGMSYWSYYWGEPQENNDEPRQLSSRRPLKFISDDDTNTVLVQGADPSQLRTIQELIDLYDVQEPVQTESARVTTVVYLQYSKARTVAEAVKEVYRDLLSSNDSAFQQQRQQNTSERTYITNIGGQEPDRTQITFKGKLSIGIDDVSNSLLVSTDGAALMENVQQLIQALDRAAMPSGSVEVMHLSGSMNEERVRAALIEIFGAQKTAQQGQQQQQQQPGQPNNNGRQPGQQGQEGAAAVQVTE